MFTKFILQIFSTWQIQFTISVIGLSLYLINKNIIKARILNRFKASELILFSLPYFNICFLILNVCVLYIKFHVLSNMLIKPIKKTLRSIIKLVKRRKPKTKTQRARA